MSQVYEDLIYFKSLFTDSDLIVKEQSELIKWSERKCYVFRFFISNLMDTEINALKDAETDINYEVIGAISLHNEETRERLLTQLDRIQNADSAFEEINKIIKENAEPNPLSLIANQFWTCAKNYLKEREYDEYPFNKSARGLLSSVAKRGYDELSVAQLEWIHALIAADKMRPSTDHFFVNQYLREKGFEADCKAIEKVWGNL